MKKIIISENKQLLPKFLYNRATTKNTSLGDNDALPQDGYYPFEYTLLKTRFRDVLEALNSIDGVDPSSIDNIASELNKTISRCKDIERVIRPNLEKVCENVVARIFTIPDETVILKCTLTDKIEPKHGYRIMPEEEDNRNYDFSSLDEISLASKAIKKRRLVNSLIQGATYNCSKNIDFYYDDIATLNEELPSLYEKIRVLNDYLLFVKQENITDDKPMQGSYVEVELGRGDEKTIINAQGLIFPFLLNETVRGFFELFASHGLPKDNSKANYIVSQADFLIAEPWDLRLGVGLWNKLSDGLDDTTLYPYFFKNLCSLKVDEFNSTLKEIFANTKKGISLLNDLYDEAYHDSQMIDLDYTIKQKNSEVAVLNDEYIAADELDDYMIEEEGEDELSGDLEEYHTPDGLEDDEIYNLIVNCSSDDIFISLNKADSDNEFYNCIVEIDGVEMPLWVVDLKCEKIRINGETVYAPHIEINEKYRHLGLGFKLYKAFLECVGNVCRNERHTYNREEMPRIYDKLNDEPNIEVENFYDGNNEIVYRIARLLSY